MSLPESCELCRPFGGMWCETPEGLRRCACERGRALMDAKKKPDPKPPVLSEETAMFCAEMLAGAGLKYYPGESGARMLIANEFRSMCNSEDEAKWLVLEMSRRYREWPGPLEMRAVFCSRIEPRDGVLASSPAVEAALEQEYIARQLDASERKLLAGATPKQIESAQAFLAVVAETVSDIVRAKDMNRALAGQKHTVRDIPAVRITDANRITAADLDKARDEYRDRKAADEVGL